MQFLRSPYEYYAAHLFGKEDGREDNVTIPGDCSLVQQYNWTDR
jgi:hypothetical protein